MDVMRHDEIRHGMPTILRSKIGVASLENYAMTESKYPGLLSFLLVLFFLLDFFFFNFLLFFLSSVFEAYLSCWIAFFFSFPVFFRSLLWDLSLSRFSTKNSGILYSLFGYGMKSSHASSFYQESQASMYYSL